MFVIFAFVSVGSGRNIEEKAVAIPVHGELEPIDVRRHQMAAQLRPGQFSLVFPFVAMDW